jgi:hypothetical protein
MTMLGYCIYAPSRRDPNREDFLHEVVSDDEWTTHLWVDHPSGALCLSRQEVERVALACPPGPVLIGELHDEPDTVRVVPAAERKQRDHPPIA